MEQNFKVVLTAYNGETSSFFARYVVVETASFLIDGRTYMFSDYEGIHISNLAVADEPPVWNLKQIF
jgi:hypothetical protein